MARAARDRHSLDLVLWTPAGHPPHKPLAGGATTEERLAMVELAIAGEAGFTVSEVDTARSGPSYAIETQALLAAQYPGAEWFWLIGEDSVTELAGWYRAAELLQRCHWLIAPRIEDAAVVAMALAELKERGARFTLLPDLPVPVSSTEVRVRASQGQPLDGLVPPAVARFIHQHGLYGSSQGTTS